MSRTRDIQDRIQDIMGDVMSQLESCPFCGHYAELIESKKCDYRIQCSHCEIGLDYPEVEYLIDTWNDRV